MFYTLKFFTHLHTQVITVPVDDSNDGNRDMDKLPRHYTGGKMVRILFITLDYQVTVMHLCIGGPVRRSIVDYHKDQVNHNAGKS